MSFNASESIERNLCISNWGHRERLTNERCDKVSSTIRMSWKGLANHNLRWKGKSYVKEQISLNLWRGMTIIILIDAFKLIIFMHTQIRSLKTADRVFATTWLQENWKHMRKIWKRMYVSQQICWPVIHKTSQNISLIREQDSTVRVVNSKRPQKFKEFSTHSCSKSKPCV